MKRIARILVTVGATAMLFAGCSKEEPVAEEPVAEEPAAEEPAAEEPAAEEPAAAAAEEGADFVKLYASHEPATEADPVIIEIQTFQVTEASFDPANLEGATAAFELDLTSIKSDKEKRDAHLQTPDYLDTGKYGMATVKVHDVKKVDDDTFSAQADVNFREMDKTFPIEFDVVGSTEDTVTIKGMHEFDRMDFGVGKEPDGENEKVAKNVKIEMQLTLKKS
ncbi:YceI family protein [Haliangium ochraceum]|uniref:YceI family protein n=1 Tax=Haliangium ochraceum (strain DSM 14365 / JCM 11303 / SMP-2) TaxID=502025 RepID=D0LIU4_HALO1|nr:YceI family protein [Haliangium ochraceum]ACY12973.1 YceI family protein [Haliangium ochraceum DSM 14365]